MNPIDQIRKEIDVLESIFTEHQLHGRGGSLTISYSDAVALLASHDAAVQRAAEMQERCAREADYYSRNSATARNIAAAIRAIKE